MNPIKKAIETRLNSLSEIYSPIKEIALKYLKHCSTIYSDNSLSIGHYPVIFPNLYTIKIFEGIKKNWINKFQNKLNINIPKKYSDFLLQINGGNLFDISLFGLTPSIYNNDGLDRSVEQCLNLDFANQDWIKEYKKNNAKLFYFGSRIYTDKENIGYFFQNNDNIIALRTNGQLINTYDNITVFLKSELKIAEEIWFKDKKIEYY